MAKKSGGSKKPGSNSSATMTVGQAKSINAVKQTGNAGQFGANGGKASGGKKGK